MQQLPTFTIRRGGGPVNGRNYLEAGCLSPISVLLSAFVGAGQLIVWIPTP